MGADNRVTAADVVTYAGRGAGGFGIRLRTGLMMALEDRADHVKSVIRDGDTKFTAAFDAIFTAVGVRLSRPLSGRRGRTRSRSGGFPALAANAWTGC